MACRGSTGYGELAQGQLAAQDPGIPSQLEERQGLLAFFPVAYSPPLAISRVGSGISVTNPRFSLKWSLKGWQPHSHMGVCGGKGEVGRGGAGPGKASPGWQDSVVWEEVTDPQASGLQKVGLAKTF